MFYSITDFYLFHLKSHTSSYLWLNNTLKCSSWIRSIKLPSWYFEMASYSFTSTLVQNFLKPNTEKTRHGYFINDFITDWDFEKKRQLKIWESGKSIGAQWQLKKSLFFSKKLLLRQILQKTGIPVVYTGFFRTSDMKLIHIFFSIW